MEWAVHTNKWFLFFLVISILVALVGCGSSSKELLDPIVRTPAAEVFYGSIAPGSRLVMTVFGNGEIEYTNLENLDTGTAYYRVSSNAHLPGITFYEIYGKAGSAESMSIPLIKAPGFGMFTYAMLNDTLQLAVLASSTTPVLADLAGHYSFIEIIPSATVVDDPEFGTLELSSSGRLTATINTFDGDPVHVATADVVLGDTDYLTTSGIGGVSVAILRDGLIIIDKGVGQGIYLGYKQPESAYSGADIAGTYQLLGSEGLVLAKLDITSGLGMSFSFYDLKADTTFAGAGNLSIDAVPGVFNSADLFIAGSVAYNGLYDVKTIFIKDKGFVGVARNGSGQCKNFVGFKVN